MAKQVRTVADLERLLAQEEKSIDELRRKRQQVAAELDELAGSVAKLKGGAAQKPRAKRAVRKKAAARPRRKRGGKSLREGIVEILSKSDRPMRAREIAEALMKSGYATSSSNPQNMVSALLAQGDDFRRLRRGLYTVKKGKAPAGGKK